MTTISRLSLVIATHNRRDELEATLAHSLALPDKVSIVVVDNASTDGTADMIRRSFPQVTLLEEERNRGASARNRGVEQISTPYVAFADDDCRWQPHSLTTAAGILDQDRRIAVLCGHVLVQPGDRDDPTSKRMARSPLGPGGPGGRAILGFMAGASVFRVDDFRRGGGFCPRFFIGGEEELLALDLATLGRQMIYCPALVVRHSPSVRRDPERRRRLLARNAIWVGWMRLPAAAAAERTLRVLWSSRPQRARILVASLAGLGWALQHRRVIPPEVENMRRRVEAMARSF